MTFQIKVTGGWQLAAGKKPVASNQQRFQYPKCFK